MPYFVYEIAPAFTKNVLAINTIVFILLLVIVELSSEEKRHKLQIQLFPFFILFFLLIIFALYHQFSGGANL